MKNKFLIWLADYTSVALEIIGKAMIFVAIGLIIIITLFSFAVTIMTILVGKEMFVESAQWLSIACPIYSILFALIFIEIARRDSR